MGGWQGRVGDDEGLRGRGIGLDGRVLPCILICVSEEGVVWVSFLAGSVKELQANRWRRLTGLW